MSVATTRPWGHCLASQAAIDPVPAPSSLQARHERATPTPVRISIVPGSISRSLARSRCHSVGLSNPSIPPA